MYEQYGTDGKGHVCHIRKEGRMIWSLGSGICDLCLDGRVHGLALVFLGWLLVGFDIQILRKRLCAVLTGVGELGAGGPAKSTVFINDVAFEVAAGPFNVREAFGDDAVLIHSSGQPVLTNEWGVTVQSLQHGAFYYLVRTRPPSYYDRAP